MQLEARVRVVESQETEMKKQADHFNKLQAELEKKAEKIKVAGDWKWLVSDSVYLGCSERKGAIACIGCRDIGKGIRERD